MTSDELRAEGQKVMTEAASVFSERKRTAEARSRRLH